MHKLLPDSLVDKSKSNWAPFHMSFLFHVGIKKEAYLVYFHVAWKLQLSLSQSFKGIKIRMFFMICAYQIYPKKESL